MKITIAPPALEYSFDFPVVVLKDGSISLWRGYGLEDVSFGLGTACKQFR